MKQEIRLANMIRDQLASAHDPLDQMSHIADVMRQFLTAHRKLVKCRTHGLLGARERIAQRATSLACQLLPAISQMPVAPTPVPAIGDTIDELRQLNEEFGGWEYAAPNKTLWVTTEAIELHNVYLGPFEIQLKIRWLGESTDAACAIVATDANPATGNDNVTHPHVNNERLCAGDASVPIRDALEAGRICDFFMLIRSVLRHYNPESPYVRLEDWTARECCECGYTVTGDAGFHCAACRHQYCDDCWNCCSNCDTSLCPECISSCPSCDEPVCPDCLETCEECKEDCCGSCLEDDLCPKCRKEKDHENQGQEEAIASQADETGAPAAA